MLVRRHRRRTQSAQRMTAAQRRPASNPSLLSSANNQTTHDAEPTSINTVVYAIKYVTSCLSNLQLVLPLSITFAIEYFAAGVLGRIYRVGQNPGPFLKCITPVYDEVRRRSILFYQDVELFIRSNTNIRNVAIFKYSWHKFGETILRRKYQLI